MSVDAETLRSAMRAWATGVTIVSARSDGLRHGMTVSSFTSISLEPPLVLVSLAASSQTHDLVLRSGYFGVTILASDQQEISVRFAAHLPESEERFAGIETEPLSSGVPFVKGGLAYLDCRVATNYPAGTNTLIVGEVIAAKGVEDVNPLLYFNQAYWQLGRGGTPDE